MARLTENGLHNDIYECKHTGEVFSHRHDGGKREKILEHNKRVRNEGGTEEKETGLAAFTIPPDDYYHVLPLTHPELFVTDKALRLQAWKQFANHPDAKPYLLNDKKTKYFGGVSNELRPAENASSHIITP